MASEWERVNKTLIAGRTTNPDLKTYALYDWAASGIYEYKLESVGIGGQKESYAKLAGPVVLDTGDLLSNNGLVAAMASVIDAREVARGEELSAKFKAASNTEGGERAVLSAWLSQELASKATASVRAVEVAAARSTPTSETNISDASDVKSPATS